MYLVYWLVHSNYLMCLLISKTVRAGWALEVVCHIPLLGRWGSGRKDLHVFKEIQVYLFSSVLSCHPMKHSYIFASLPLAVGHGSLLVLCP